MREQELKDIKETLTKAKRDLSIERNKRITAEDNLKRKAVEVEELDHKLKEMNDVANRLQERLLDKDQIITQLGSDVSEAKFEISSLEAELNKSRRDMEDVRMRNRTLSLDINTLKVALADCEEELRRSLDNAKYQKENMTKREIDIRRSLESNLVTHNLSTSRNLINAFQSLSSQILTIQRTQLSTEQLADIQQKIGELTATNKFLEEKILGYKEKEEVLLKRVVELQEDCETAKIELSEMQRKLIEVEGNSSLTHKFLLEESNKIKQQKADLRCELLELRREYSKQKDELAVIEKSKMNEEEISKLRAELDLCRSHEDDLKRSETRLKTQLCLSEEKVKELEKSLSSVRSEVDDLSVEKDLNRELRLELKNAETKLVELTNALQIVDSQCEQFRELRKRADISKQKALDECASVTTKLRKIEKELERQRNFEVEVNQLRAEKERLEMKIRYLNDEIRETHNDYRSELAQLAKQISETKLEDESEVHNVKIDEMKRQIAQFDNISRGNKRKLDELEKENQILQEQISAGVARELVATNENKKLRGGLADAVVKIELYKNEAEHSKKSCEQLAVQLALNEERINKLEEEVINLEEALREKEKLEAYLQSQIKTKDMPKLSRRSTLLRSSTESSFEMVDPVVVEELENQKTYLLKELEEKKKELMTRKMMPLTLRSGDQTSVPYIPPRHPLTELQSNFVTDICTYHKEKSSNITIPISQKAVMRHDIPHKWAELRHFGLFSIKCAVCFVGVPTFAKKKRCTYCGIIVHSQCALRVVNTCGLPDQCANYYLESQRAQNGKMNGWVRIFSDDSSTREWHSAWGEMDEKQLVFYNNDATQSDLKSPFLMIDLEKELCIVRVVNEMPLKAEKGQMSHNIVHIRTENRNIYILAPSTQTAERWAEALQNASTRRMMLTRRPSSFAEQSCILVLSKPNNLTIHTTCVIDNCLLIGAQSGLFFTHVNTPRLPVRIGGFNSITAIECLQDINMLVFVIDHHRLLAFVPLLALKSELHVAQPYLRADVMPGYENIHMVAQHRQEKHWYLFAASSTKIYVLRYNMARDIFVAHQVMETNEPVVCIQSAPNGVYFGSDSFYFVQLGHTELEPIRVADPSIADYPIAVFPVGENEVILAYQNYGLFVNSHGKRTRSKVVEWEQMPMEFAYTAPYLYVIHYDSIEIMRIADYHGLDSSTILDEREVYECRNAHVVCCCPNGDVFISISNTESVEVHRFNATNCKKNTTKRKGYNLGGSDKRSKVDI